MLIRYHLVYYAVFCVIAALAHLVHPLFFFLLILYIYFLYKRLGARSLLISVILLLVILRPDSRVSIPIIIEGDVKDVRTGYVIIQTTQGKIKAYTKTSLLYNDHLVARISLLEMNKQANDNGFDESLYLKANRIVAKTKITKILKKTHAYSFANTLESHFSENKRIRSYQRLFALGVRDDEISGDYATMSVLSIVHMFALSGMHISLLHKVILALLSIKISKEKASFIAKILLGFYVFSIPYNISLLRAYFMLVLYAIFKDYFNALDILSFLALYHITTNPYVIFSISFVFSYFAYAIVLLTSHTKGNMMFVYLGGIPIVMNLSYTINYVSFLLSLILMPFIEVLYILSLLSVFLPWLDPLISACLFLFQSILAFTTYIGQSLSFQKPTIAFYGLYYFAFFSMILNADRQRSYKKQVLFLMSLMLSFHIYSTYKIYSEVTMINVDQGDCTLVRLPFNQANILIDTGGNRSYDIATNRLIPYLKSVGIDHLDYVYISHDDYDHCGALESLQTHFKVEKVIRGYQKEEKKIGSMTLRMLKSEEVYQDKNDGSQVIYMTLEGWHYLFTGDISAIAEKDLYEKYGSLDVDVLKVAHHGSGGSSSVPFFEMVHPRIAMIGVGKDNFYGHPTKLVIERLTSREIKILRTDLHGSFTLRNYGKDHYIFK